ncbi:head-tail adaptor protein [Kaistia sp. 32K]|uniref:phage head closure protein n=1 Tax=Kaistia sp. 32K TaxID=2795690 RepID=UPI0019150F65|nr:phage head closure protein [Kaistia sp. 32K]BCP52824.1 head-tail adaptor protein [Kaistia sp. 32K]
MTGFDPGQLSSRVVLERAVRTADGAGGATIAWEPVATLWAAIEPVVADESFAADRLSTRVTHRIRIRFRTDLEGGMRIAHRGRVLRIAAWRDPDETRRFLVLESAEERA